MKKQAARQIPQTNRKHVALFCLSCCPRRAPAHGPSHSADYFFDGALPYAITSNKLFYAKLGYPLFYSWTLAPPKAVSTSFFCPRPLCGMLHSFVFVSPGIASLRACARGRRWVPADTGPAHQRSACRPRRSRDPLPASHGASGVRLVPTHRGENPLARIGVPLRLQHFRCG